MCKKIPLVFFFGAMVFAVAFFSSCSEKKKPSAEISSENVSQTDKAETGETEQLPFEQTGVEKLADQMTDAVAADDKAVVAPEVSGASVAEKGLLASMTNRQKIAQLFLVTFGGTGFAEPYDFDTENADSYPVPGGYLLFSYNFTERAEDIVSLTSDCRNFYRTSGLVPPYFSVDQEGGLVNRMRDLASPLPSAQSIAKFLSPELATAMYNYGAEQIACCGIDVNFGPVVEASGNQNEDFLGNRCYGNEEKVRTFGGIFIDCMKNHYVYPVVKHFPGNSADDPHLGLPFIEAADCDYSTFDIAVQKNTGVLVGHTVLSGIDEVPSCLSKKIVGGLLKEKIGVSGLVFSDDILMDALQKNGFDSVTAMKMAILSGIDVLMITQKEYAEFLDPLEELYEKDQEFAAAVDSSLERILAWKAGKKLLNFDDENGYSVPEALSETELSGMKEKLCEDFYKAKEKGSALYHDYFKS
ncbi:MAG: hypothetical protein MJ183_09230 [Treponemataceae bacterium]|nr:hypothetical protein [Treponemataceae bacterium]